MIFIKKKKTFAIALLKYIPFTQNTVLRCLDIFEVIKQERMASVGHFNITVFIAVKTNQLAVEGGPEDGLLEKGQNV